MLRRDADARVAHFDHALARRPPASARRRAYPHAPAGRREVDRVAEQIADDVRDLLAVGVERRERRRDLDGRASAPSCDERLVQRRDLATTSTSGTSVGATVELVRRAARVGEDLADLIEQLAAAVDDPARCCRCCRVVSAPSIPSRRISACVMIGGERRAQIVRDVREELRLERVARLQLGDIALSLPRASASSELARPGARRARGDEAAEVRADSCVRSYVPSRHCSPAVNRRATVIVPSSIDSSSCCREQRPVASARPR